MSRMLCKCGATMGTSNCPSPYSMSIYYENEVQSALTENPSILLIDFLTDWDAVNDEQKIFMKRTEEVEYWYCTECQRVFEVQALACGHWLRVYQRIEFPLSGLSPKDWGRIYVFKDLETDAALEEFPQILLSEYLNAQAEIQYFLSPDERTVTAILSNSQEILFSYMQEATINAIE